MQLLSRIADLLHLRKEKKITSKRIFARAERRRLAKIRAQMYAARLAKRTRLSRRERRQMGRSYAAFMARREGQVTVRG